MSNPDEVLNETFEMAVALFKDIYQITDTWPRLQTFSLIMDLRRTALNISMNLSEAWQSSGVYSQAFLSMAHDLFPQLQECLRLAQKQSNLDQEPLLPLMERLAQLQERLAALAPDVAQGT